VSPGGRDQPVRIVGVEPDLGHRRTAGLLDRDGQWPVQQHVDAGLAANTQRQHPFRVRFVDLRLTTRRQ
jgi:regulation of enolase protein 1 (concanavalin A-like superfamily)